MKNWRKVTAKAGDRYGRLTLLQDPVQDRVRNFRWVLCQCDCGTQKNMRLAALVRNANAVKSCGCLRIEAITKHGHAQRAQGSSPEYKAWYDMRVRCGNPRNKSFHSYGGRGIIVCERWADFANFLSDVGPRPSPRHSLDRIDNHGNYEPENCRWATRTQQARNTRINRWIEIGGATKTLSEWAVLYGIAKGTVSARICKGWSAVDAITTPVVRTA